MNIWILETGGTIASKKLDQTIDLSLKKSDYSAFGEVTVRRPYYILSENLTPDRWVTLAQEVRLAWESGAEGILITHGSDTLPYTAAALSFLLSDIKIPVVVTASNRPPEEEGSNATNNLVSAMELLKIATKEVSVVWQNPDGAIYAHRGTSLSEAVGDWFFSWEEPLGTLKNGMWDFHSPSKESVDPISLPKSFLYNISVLSALPGQDYTKILFNKNSVAVLQTLYHSGTVCAEGETTGFEQLKTRCRRENLPLYICPVKKSGEVTYASARVLEGEEVFPLPGLSPEAAYVLLCLAYNQEEENPTDVVSRFVN